MPNDKQAAQADQRPIPVSRAAQIEEYGRMILAVPEAEDDDGFGIIAGVLEAGSWEDLNTGGGLPEAEDFEGKRMVIRSITRRESTVEGAESPWYFVVDADSGQPDFASMRFATSSRTIMAQLVKCHVHGWFPIVATVVKSDKATRKGFRPLSLRIEGRG